MTLEQLRTLCRIVECGSLGKAAESLNKTQPALSMAIKKLETEYGFRILNRDGYRLCLTQEGKSFYRKAEELLRNAEELSSSGKRLGAGNEPLVRFAYDQTLPQPLLLKVLKQCQQQFPDTELHVIAKTRFGALELLQQRKVDLAVSLWWPSMYNLGDFATATVSHIRNLLVASPTLFGTEKLHNADQLRSSVNIVIEDSELSFDTENLTPLKGVRQWKTRDAFTLKLLLMAGLGWSYLPEQLVSEELKQGSLVILEPQDLEFCIEGESRLIRRQDLTPGPVANLLWQGIIAGRDL